MVKHRVRALAPVAGLGLILFQAWAYARALPLILGPRVILQPWLLRRGFVMYESIIDIHTPLMPLVIAALAPLNPDGLILAKSVLIALLSLTTFLTFAAAARKSGGMAGVWAAFFVVVWSPTFGFTRLWHESFLAPLYLLLFLAYDGSVQRRSIRSCLYVGLLGGAAVLTKQHAAVVFAAFVAWMGASNWYSLRSGRELLREIALMLLGALLPVAAYTVYQYSQAGSVANFLYWTIGYALTSDFKTLASMAPTPVQVELVTSSCLLLPLAIFAAIDGQRKGDIHWRQRGLGMALIAASTVTEFPRFGMFHLQATLPLVAVVSALALRYLARLGPSWRVVAASLALALPVYWLTTAVPAYRPALAPRQPQTILQYSNLVPLAADIRANIGPTDCVYVYTDDEANSNLYYVLRCLPPKYWIFHYPWYMQAWMRKRIILSLEADSPKWVVYFPDHWGINGMAPEFLKYLEDHYQTDAELTWAGQDVLLLRRDP